MMIRCFLTYLLLSLLPRAHGTPAVSAACPCPCSLYCTALHCTALHCTIQSFALRARLCKIDTTTSDTSDRKKVKKVTKKQQK
jgi:hypothetical protein